MKTAFQVLAIVFFLQYVSNEKYELIRSPKAINSFKAWENCLSKDKTLANLHNTEERDELIEAIRVQNTIDLAWIGLYRILEIDTNLWMDGSSTAFLEKSQIKPSYSRSGSCGVLQRERAKIIYSECDKLLFAYICKEVDPPLFEDVKTEKKLPIPQEPKKCETPKTEKYNLQNTTANKNSSLETVAVESETKKGILEARAVLPLTYDLFSLQTNSTSTISPSSSLQLFTPLYQFHQRNSSSEYSTISKDKDIIFKNVIKTTDNVEKHVQTTGTYSSEVFPSSTAAPHNAVVQNSFQRTKNAQLHLSSLSNVKLYETPISSEMITYTNPSTNSTHRKRRQEVSTKTPLSTLNMVNISTKTMTTLTSRSNSKTPFKAMLEITPETYTVGRSNDIIKVTRIPSPTWNYTFAMSTLSLLYLTNSSKLSPKDGPQAISRHSFLSKSSFRSYSNNHEIAEALQALEQTFIQLAFDNKKLELEDEFHELKIKTLYAGDSTKFSEEVPLSKFKSSSVNMILVEGIDEDKELTVVMGHLNVKKSTMKHFQLNLATHNSDTKTKYLMFNDTGILTVSAIDRTERKVVNASVSFTFNSISSPPVNEVLQDENSGMFTSRYVTKNIEFACKFVDPDTKSLSEEGCKNKVSNMPGSLRCDCSHTTAFAVLLSVTSFEIPFSVKVVSFVTQSISIIFLIMTLVVLLKVRRRIRNDRTSVQINLVIALLLLHIVSISHDAALKNNRTCEMVAILTHFSLLASVFWMLVEGITLVTKTMKSAMVRRNIKKVYCMQYGIGWILPATIVVISVTVGFTTQSYMKVNPMYTYTITYEQPLSSTVAKYNQCWIHGTSILASAVVFPVSLVVLINTAILIRMSCMIFHLNTMTDNFKPVEYKRSTSTKRRSNHLKATFKSVTLLLPVLGLPLVIGLIANNKETSEIWMYLTSIVNGLQGMFLFLIYCVRGREVREAAKRTWSQSQSQVEKEARNYNSVSIFHMPRMGQKDKKRRSVVTTRCSVVEGKYTGTASY